MSTEHQKYSTENQAEIIAQYADRRGFEIVRTYEDSGKSGLRLDGRQALQLLIADVRSRSADFAAILVYDVSRWGRFQDADESAYYEFICREAGFSVHYCAEQFVTAQVRRSRFELAVDFSGRRRRFSIQESDDSRIGERAVQGRTDRADCGATG
jgi:DNA invertase Pin-like site-specific DNA recombinase